MPQCAASHGRRALKCTDHSMLTERNNLSHGAKLFQHRNPTRELPLLEQLRFFPQKTPSLFPGRFAPLLPEALGQRHAWKAGCCFGLLEAGIPSSPQRPSLQNAAVPLRPKERAFCYICSPFQHFLFPDLKISAVYRLFMQNQSSY